ncbi:DNA replication and repair protein RecF, partial [Enterococcus faecalis]|nr:DNA replication and repair protein RecF [Enterococcus faecalis]
SSVIKQRLDFVKQLETFSQAKHYDISDQKEELNLSYQSSFPFESIDTLRQDFRQALDKSRQRDLFKKNTGVGPHRDDLTFFINGMNAHFGSQGQHRSLVLSVKLAEIDLMESVTKESPILLLDDVMSELDNNRQLKLLETISDSIQTFITTTSLDHLKQLPETLKIFHIDKGVIRSD